MHVRNLRFYQTMQFVLDLLAVTVAWSCTIQMRVLLNPLTTQRVSWTYASIWAPSLMMVLILWVIMAWRLRFYRVEGRIRLWNCIINAAEGALAGKLHHCHRHFLFPPAWHRRVAFVLHDFCAPQFF